MRRGIWKEQVLFLIVSNASVSLAIISNTAQQTHKIKITRIELHELGHNEGLFYILHCFFFLSDMEKIGLNIFVLENTNAIGITQKSPLAIRTSWTCFFTTIVDGLFIFLVKVVEHVFSVLWFCDVSSRGLYTLSYKKPLLPLEVVEKVRQLIVSIKS